LKCEKIWQIWKKAKLNSEKIWKIWRKSKLNSEKRWKIWKISVLVIITPKETYSSSAAAAAAAITLKFHPKHVTNKNKAKHIMKLSYINVNIYDKTATSQQNSD
jgi:hypothetical protein